MKISNNNRNNVININLIIYFKTNKTFNKVFKEHIYIDYNTVYLSFQIDLLL